MVGNLAFVLLSAILVNNFLLSRFLGICPFLGISKQVETAFGMGMAVTFVMAMASAITYVVQMLLVVLHLEYLQTLTFILVIAALVQLVELVLKKVSPGLYKALGVYLPLITTNCAVLGVTLINMTEKYDFITSVVNGIGGALGFTLIIVIFAAIRERQATNKVYKSFEGFPLALVTAGLLSLAFMGFNGFNLKALLGL
ncbi:MAG TPA: electron transport complex subunit RsxA [Firmicutes bacterium]|nr:electron transport complex subunit RsxA [Bacillota bacterium]